MSVSRKSSGGLEHSLARPAILDSSLRGAHRQKTADKVGLTAALHSNCDGDWVQTIPSSRPASPPLGKARRVKAC